ncbi:glycosyltransferase family 4 protein [Namhaeicola litoreus]|uniref:Glycosyltransferase family 4 protein n=1 Tax=Namhaeicola litoreus TaxID=1052145 RepID=A0ABW3Y388_9FLAO
MKVLLITYYWPPAGGSGVQRWLYFTKYLTEMGVDVVVYTPENPEYAIVDQNLVNEVPNNLEVIRTKIFEPNQILTYFNRSKKQESAGFLNPNPGFLERQLQYIRANFFIPDARKFWVKPSVDFLTDYLRNNHVDVVISSGPPHSMHLIGLALKEKLGVKWVADFRDPWLDIDYFHQLPLSKKSKRKHAELEKKVAEKADLLLVVGKSMKDYFKQFNDNSEVLSNGFAFKNMGKMSSLDTAFSLTHIGLMNADRNPEILWDVLADLIKADEEFSNDLSINLIGKVDSKVKDQIKKNNLEKQTNYVDYLPYDEVVKNQNSAQVLLLPINQVPFAKGIITGKVFEYLQSKRPILAIAPKEGDLAEIINETKSGVVIDFREKEKLKEVILSFYKSYKAKNLFVDSENIDQYDRKEIAKNLYALLNKINAE